MRGRLPVLSSTTSASSSSVPSSVSATTWCGPTRRPRALDQAHALALEQAGDRRARASPRWRRSGSRSTSKSIVADTSRDAHPVGAVDLRERAAGGDHGLGGDAVPQVGGTADDVALDQGDLGPEAGRVGGGLVARRSPTDDHEALGHGARLPASGRAETHVQIVAGQGVINLRAPARQLQVRTRRTRRLSAVNSCRVRPTATTVTLVATDPRIRYMMASWTCTASTGLTPGQDQPGHGAGQEHQPDGLGRLDLGDHGGAHRLAQVGPRRLLPRQPQRQAGLDLQPLVATARR